MSIQSKHPGETVVLGRQVEGAGDPACILVHGITLDRNDLRPLA